MPRDDYSGSPQQILPGGRKLQERNCHTDEIDPFTLHRTLAVGPPAAGLHVVVSHC